MELPIFCNSVLQTHSLILPHFVVFFVSSCLRGKNHCAVVVGRVDINIALFFEDCRSLVKWKLDKTNNPLPAIP